MILYTNIRIEEGEGREREEGRERGEGERGGRGEGEGRERGRERGGEEQQRGRGGDILISYMSARSTACACLLRARAMAACTSCAAMSPANEIVIASACLVNERITGSVNMLAKNNPKEEGEKAEEKKKRRMVLPLPISWASQWRVLSMLNMFCGWILMGDPTIATNMDDW